MAFKAVSEHLRTADDYELITWRMLERLARQGVVHAEVYVSVGVVYYWRRCEFEPLFVGMERARVRAEAELGISVYWIFDAVRHFGPGGGGSRLSQSSGVACRSFRPSSGSASAGMNAALALNRSANSMRRLATPGCG